MLETVDLEFDRVLEERREYVEETKTAPVKDEPLNVDSLASILSGLLPAENKGDDEPYADLLENLTALGVDSVEALLTIIERHSFAVGEYESKRVTELQAASELSLPLDRPEIRERLERGVFFQHVGLAREALSCEFGEEKLRNVMKARKPKAKRRRSG